jgi:predicted HTH domain antitoxin
MGHKIHLGPRKTPTEAKARLTYVNIKLFGAAKREQNVREDIDIALIQQGRVVVNSEAGIPEYARTW